MRIFLYEFVTGGGFWSASSIRSVRDALGKWPPPASLLAEGAAMWSALAGDLAESANVTSVISSRDIRLADNSVLSNDRNASCDIELRWIGSASDELRVLEEAARDCDAVWLIAPEIGGALLRTCRIVESGRGRLVSPDAAFVAIASDKHATCERLESAGVPVPRGVLVNRDTIDASPTDKEQLDALPFPVVIKPIDGAGSWNVQRVDDRSSLDRVFREWRSPSNGGSRTPLLRIESYHAGRACSVALLCGPSGLFALPACEQQLSDDGWFEYQGGAAPLDDALSHRAAELATRAVLAMPPARGYVGVDLVLGEAPDGSDDVVIEINPRLTTSYVGLRRLCTTHLADAILDVAAGRMRPLAWRKSRVEFTPLGDVAEAADRH